MTVDGSAVKPIGSVASLLRRRFGGGSCLLTGAVPPGPSSIPNIEVCSEGGETTLAKGFSIGDDAEASQQKFLESPAGLVADASPGPARATYQVEIPADGPYVFWGRFFTPDRDHNRVWVRVDEGTWTKLRVTTGESWFWFTFHKDGQFELPISYELTEGTHTLTVASDTDGVKIDRFYVTPGADRPMGDDTLCNPPHTIDSGGACLDSCGGLMGSSCDAVICEGKTLLPAYDCEVCCKL